jgi:hypothetical protein
VNGRRKIHSDIFDEIIAAIVKTCITIFPYAIGKDNGEIMLSGFLNTHKILRRNHTGLGIAHP